MLSTGCGSLTRPVVRTMADVRGPKPTVPVSHLSPKVLGEARRRIRLAARSQRQRSL